MYGGKLVIWRCFDCFDYFEVPGNPSMQKNTLTAPAIFMERSYFREMLLTHEQTTWDAVLVKSYTIFSQLTSSSRCQNQYIIIAATVVSNNMLLGTSWPCVRTCSAWMRLRGWRSPPVNGSLKAAWINNPPAPLPQPLDHRGKGLDQGALHGRVARVDLPQVLVVQQVVRQLLRVAQALQISVVVTIIMRKEGGSMLIL